MKIILFFMLILSGSVFAQRVHIMTYNTMCDFCNGSNFFKYDDRIKHISETIKTLSPDIIGIQEVRLASQIKKIISNFDKYAYFTTEGLLYSYADPAIIYDKNKFKIIKLGQFWLGPNNGKLSLGWKFSLPRQVLWAEFKIKSSNKNFLFMTTHIDNRIENMDGSIKMIRDFIMTKELPLILAADTNMTYEMPQYKQLIKDIFHNAFDLKSQFTVVGNYNDEKELCYLKKGSKFPSCRVDHILLSKNHSWKVHQYVIDATKNGQGEFSSDHRAAMAILEI